MRRTEISTQPRTFGLRTVNVALALLSTVALALTGTVPAHAATPDDSSLSTYVVDAPTLHALRSAVDEIPNDRGAVLTGVGAAVVELTAAEASALDARPGVVVAPDAYLSTLDTQDHAPWHLDRLDQTTAVTSADVLTNQYWYPQTAGAGVRVYIVDSGVWAGHPDLIGRVAPGYDATTGVEGPTTDCNGHGTAVASAAAGTRYGVAKRATIVPVRVADCQGQASVSAVIAGLDWIVRTNPAGTPATINISLGVLDKYGSSALATLEAAITTTISKGFFTAIAAGNDGNGGSVPEACQASPARTPTAFTTGASDVRADGVEGRADFSNAGTCIDAFAPGVGVLTASVTGPDDYRDGTSFSSPIVAGLAAIHLGTSKTDTPKQTTDSLLSAAQQGALTNNSGWGLGSTVHYTGSVASATTTASPNLYVQTPAPLPDQSSVVAGLRNSARTPTSLTFSWTPSPHSTRIDFGVPGATPTSVNVTGSSHTFTGLAAGGTYRASARTLTDGLLGSATATVTAVPGAPLTVVPGAVQALTSTLTSPTSTAGPRATLAWSPPSVLGSSATTDYVIQWSKDGGAWMTYADGVNVARTWTTPALSPSSKYSFRVFVKNSQGTGPGAYVSASIGRSTPSAVQGLSTTAVAPTSTIGQKIVLGWGAPADTGFAPVTDYIVQWSKDGVTWTTYADGKSASRSFTTPALEQSTGYAFRVLAVNSWGAGPAATKTVSITRIRPAAVTGLTRTLAPATAQSTARITLAWSAPADPGYTPVTDYYVQASKNGGAWTTYPDGKSATRTFTTPPLTIDATYAFRVLAVNSYGPGPATALAPTTTRDRPGAVQNVGAILSTTTGSLTARLTWAAAKDPGFTPVTDYIVQYAKNGGAWTTYPDGKGTGLGYVTPPLDRGTGYAFRVFAVNSFGTGPGNTIGLRTP